MRRIDHTSAGPRPLPDYVAPGLRLLFVGINPGIISATAGHYYANPRNTFWRLLYEARLTPVRLRPENDARLPALGFGLTDIVKRPSRGARDLKRAEFVSGRRRLTRLVKRLRPRALCFNSKIAFEGYFGRRAFRRFGPQAVRVADTPVFVLPSTSPANAAIPLAVKRRHFQALKTWLAAPSTDRILTGEPSPRRKGPEGPRNDLLHGASWTPSV